MSDIERIPSMRRPARQGVPKRKPRDMAKPEPGGRTREAAPVEPKAAAEPVVEATLPVEPVLLEEPALPIEPEPIAAIGPEPVAAAEPEPEPASEPEPVPEPEPTVPVPPPPVRSARVETVPSPPEPDAAAADLPPLSMRELSARVDGAWYAFRAVAFRFPAEHMDDHLTEDGWTRKQMLAHIATWHDLTSDRLVKLTITGRPALLELDTDAVNAAAARVAVGKTAGEVLKDVEATFNRLHRQMQRLSDAQLRLANGWAAQIIAANTYEHYAEHMAELVPPEPPPGSGTRR